MKVITPLDIDPMINKTDIAVFLAGGISNCPDWQNDLISHIRVHFGSHEDLIIYNPRRPTYEDSVEIATQQITWERIHLHKSQIILFWFPCETLCPITLFEYGYWLATLERTTKPRLVVGCHPDYKRKLDLEVQTKLTARTTNGVLVSNWDGLMNDLLEQYSYEQSYIATYGKVD